MAGVVVRVFHAEPGPRDGELTRATAAARRDLADRHVAGFLEAGASDALVVAGPPDELPFGERLRTVAAGIGDAGLIVLGSGAMPLATLADRRTFVEAAGAREPRALTNNRYSADIIAIARARSALAHASLGSLATDNALPRWLTEVAGVPVDDLRRRPRLGVDVDGPLDLVLLGGRWTTYLSADHTATVRRAVDGVRAVAADPSGELVVAGRLSARELAWLERETASRTRALIEERGVRTRRPAQRPAVSILGMLLDREGPESLGTRLANMGQAAVVDTRVLLAHHFGADEAAWPPAEDRFASDVLLPDRILEPWLRALTLAASQAPVPVLLGGHTLVGPALRLAIGGRR